MTNASRWKLLGVLAIVAFVPYLNSLGNGFVYDDREQVLTNPYIRDFHHLREIFTSTSWSFLGGYRGASNYYRPLMTLTYLLCHRFFGFNSMAFHLVNVLFNVGVVVLVFLATRRMFQDDAVAFIASVVFALHPIHTEAVNWVAALTELQLAFFCLLTFWFFQGARPVRDGRGWASAAQIGMAASFAGALLSKEQAVTLPALATLYEHFFRQDRDETTCHQKLRRYAGLWLLAFVYLAFRVHQFGSIAPTAQRPGFSSGAIVISALALVAQYFWKLVWPAHLNAFYVFPEDLRGLLPWSAAGLILLAGLVLLFVTFWKKDRTGGFGLVWFILTLSPVLNPAWLAQNVFTERYLYLPSVGFCWLVAWLAVKLWRRPTPGRAAWRTALVAAGCVLAGLAALRTVTRNRVWRDNVVLYTTTLASSPDAFYIQNNLASVYFDRDDFQAAEREWREAQKLAPNDPIVLHNLGLISLNQKRYDEAAGYFLRALMTKPDYADAHLDLGRTYQAMGLRDRAEAELKTAVTIAPLDPRARNALGELYFDAGRLGEAKEQFDWSIDARPTREGYWDLGLVYWSRHQRDLAERAFKNAETLAPSSSRVHFILGLFYADSGRIPEAIGEYQSGLKFNPNNQEALTALKKLSTRNADTNTPHR